MNKRFVFAAVIFFISLLAIVSLKAVQLYRNYTFQHSLKNDIEKQALSFKTDYSFFVKDLGFWGLESKFKEEERFAAASLIKLPILAAAFKAVSEGKISLNDAVFIRKEDITGGSGKLKKYRLPHQLTFKELLELMITVSDNTAANKVIELVELDYINKSFKELGLADTILVREMMDFSLRSSGVENYTSSRDITHILEKIYNKTFISEEFSYLALSFLKKQKVNDRLPYYLPKETVVAHKTGLERGVVHDAGIVFSPAGNYIICILTKNAASHQGAKKFIAKASLLAYNLYNK
ncbi:MAG: serine hydrolase [Candidatus Omnitrophota bacterium]